MAATRVSILKGTAAECSGFTGLIGELVYDSTAKAVRVHDGATVGGFALARADGSNWPVPVNLGTGEGVLITSTGPVTAKSLRAGTNVTLTSSPTEITIDVTGGGGGGVTDHGALTGLADDDHTQYLIGNVGTSTTRNSITMGVGGRGLNIDAVDSVDTHIRLTLNGVQFATWNNESGIVIEPGAGGIQADHLVVLASNTGRATVNIPHGTAPTTPTNGAVWTTTSGMFVRINGSTVGPLVSSNTLNIPSLANETDTVFADSTVVHDASASANREVTIKDILSNPRRRILIEEEFCSRSTAPFGPFLFLQGGSGALVNSGNDDPQAFGVAWISTQTGGAGTRGALMTDPNTTRLGGARMVYNARVLACDILSDATDSFTTYHGFGDTDDGSTDAVFFRYTHSVNGGRWQAVCRSNGSESWADTGVAVVANTFAWLTIEINAAANEANFYINSTLVATRTTNIPTGVGRSLGVIAANILKNAGTSARRTAVDYCSIEVEWATAR